MPTVNIPPIIARLSGVTPAPMFWRILALSLDCILAGFVATILLTRLVLPQSHPDAENTMRGELQAMNAEVARAQKTGATPQFTLNDEAQGIIEDTGKTFFLTMLLYFTISELVTGGSTLGKRVFGLRAARWDTGERPGVMEIVFRNLFKTASLLPLGPVPVILLANVIPVFVRSTRRAGHDYLTRTMVTRDAPPPLPEGADHHHDDEE